VQARNIRALMLRDIVMRYGRGNVGFVWVVLEPMLLTVGVMFIWSIMGGGKNGIKVIEFVLTGYMPLTLWRHMTNNTVRIFRGSSPLLYHRKLSLLDIVGARLALEFIATTTALLIIWGTLSAAGAIGEIQRLDLVLLGWGMMGLIGAAAGIGLAIITETSESAERLVQPIQYLNIPISGAFLMVEWLPPWGQELILYHPLVHCYEVFRAGYFGPSIQTHYNIPYYAACCLVLAFVSLVSVGSIRSKIQLS